MRTKSVNTCAKDSVKSGQQLGCEAEHRGSVQSSGIRKSGMGWGTVSSPALPWPLCMALGMGLHLLGLTPMCGVMLVHP